MWQASGRVDVPDGTKIVLHVSGHGVRMRSGTSRERLIQFFLTALGGNTRAVRCVESDTIHEAVSHVHGNIYIAVESKAMTRCVYIQAPSATRCWFARRSCHRCGARRPDSPPGVDKRWKKGSLGRDPPVAQGNVPPTTSVRQPKVVPPRGPPGARVGPSPSTPKEGSVPNEDLFRALQLLQGS